MEERDITDKGETWSMKTDLNIYESLIIRQYLRWENVKERILEIQSNPGSRDRVTGGWDTCQGGIGAIQLFRRHSKPQKLHRERYDRSLTIFPWLCFSRPNNSRVKFTARWFKWKTGSHERSFGFLLPNDFLDHCWAEWVLYGAAIRPTLIYKTHSNIL